MSRQSQPSFSLRWPLARDALDVARREALQLADLCETLYFGFVVKPVGARSHQPASDCIRVARATPLSNILLRITAFVRIRRYGFAAENLDLTRVTELRPFLPF